MADINSPVEIGVTTGPIRGSRKVHVAARTGSGVRVAMREIDLESKTTKEGRLETLVTIAVEKNGRVYKEIVLSFPDQHKGSTFVNCLSLFAMALRKTT